MTKKNLVISSVIGMGLLGLVTSVAYRSSIAHRSVDTQSGSDIVTTGTHGVHTTHADSRSAKAKPVGGEHAEKSDGAGERAGTKDGEPQLNIGVSVLQDAQSYSELVDRIYQADMPYREKFEYSNLAKILCGSNVASLEFGEVDVPKSASAGPATVEAQRSAAYVEDWKTKFCDMSTDDGLVFIPHGVSGDTDPGDYAPYNMDKLMGELDFQAARNYGEQVLRDTQSPLTLLRVSDSLRSIESLDSSGVSWQFGRQYIGERDNSYGNTRFRDLQMLAVEMVACNMGNICGAGDLLTLGICQQYYQCGPGRNLEDIWDITYSPAALALARKMADDLRHMRDGG